MAPCGTQLDEADVDTFLTDKWGCGTFVRELGLQVIPEDTAITDKPHTPDPRVLPVCL